MGGEMSEGPLFVESDKSLRTPLAELHGWDLTEIYHTNPQRLADAITRANELDNQELALFMTGVLAARMLEQPINTGTRRRPKFEHPSGYTASAYGGALHRVLPQMEIPLLPS